MNYIKVAFFLYFLFHLGPTIAADQFLSNSLSEEALQESKRDISAAILAAGVAEINKISKVSYDTIIAAGVAKVLGTKFAYAN